jgi:glutamyl-tRNA reductase
MKPHETVVTCVGLNHQTSPVEEREQLAFAPDELPQALADLGDALGGAVLLSTCNRTELYATVPEGSQQAARLIGLLNGVKGSSVDASRFYVHQHDAAIRHLFRVAAGIDSMVLGESQILGQVRDAMSAATQAGTLNGALSKLFHAAIGAGKRARTETHIGRNAVSVGSAAVTLARRALGDLREKTVLVISAGSMGKLAARALADTGGAQIVVANRTRERAQELAAEMGPDVQGVALADLHETLSGADIVISGTAAEGYIVQSGDVMSVMAGRNGRGLLFIDIAVPRDIDPAVAEVHGVHLFDIDDIEAVTASGLNGREQEVERVEAIIEEEVAAFLEWWRSLDVVPVIAALRERAESIRRQEVERTLGRLTDLDDESRQRIEAMTAAIVKKMLDRPIARLKDGADKGLYMEALEDLFDLPASGPRTFSRGG